MVERVDGVGAAGKPTAREEPSTLREAVNPATAG